MSIRVTLNCQIKPDLLSSLQTFLQANLPRVRSFKGNLRVSVLFNEEKHEMLLDEDWISAADHQAYLQFIDNNGVLNELADFLTEPPTIRYFQLADI